MRADLESLLATYSRDELALEADALACERDLARFYREAWPCFDPAPFKSNWHLDCMADHLMAFADGEIKNLLINVPFRTGKSTLVSVSFPSWVWAQRKRGPRKGPQVTFLTASYAANLAGEIALQHNRLVKHPWYQARWGHRFKIRADQDSREHFSNDKQGGRISIGLEGGTPGRGGTVTIFDDPHKVQDVESDDTRESQIRIYDEGFATRFTDPQEAGQILVMQRLAENDLSGHIIEKFIKENRGDWIWLMLPMEYDPQRHCVTVLKWRDSEEEPGTLEPDIEWEDPRRYDEKTGEERPDEESENELLWPERFPRDVLTNLKTSLGPYGVAGQLQQSPEGRGGNLILRDWWIPWRSRTFPDFGTVVLSMDTAFKKGENNSYNAIVCLGAFAGEGGRPQIMLKDAWRARCTLAELVDMAAAMGRKHKADYLLIEDKSRGQDVNDEVLRLHAGMTWSVQLLPVASDKIGRTVSVQPMWSGDARYDEATGMTTWSGGVMYAPMPKDPKQGEYDWVEMVIDEMSKFPKGSFNDLHDAAVQGVWWMRRNGVILRKVEYDEEEERARTFTPEPKPLYDV